MAAGELAESELGRQLATLTLAHVRPAGVDEAIRAAGWSNLLARLGVRLPLCLVQDFGLLLTQRRERSERRVTPPAAAASLAPYAALLGLVEGADLGEQIGSTPLRDEMVAALLARVLGELAWRWPRSPGTVTPELPLVSPLYDLPPEELAARFDVRWCAPLLRSIGDSQAIVMARMEQLEGGVLRLLGYFSADDGAAPDLAGLYEMVSTAGVAEVADFSLQLLPSLLETKRRPASQRFAIDGYAAIERRGSPDALLPSELAHDDEVFELKALQEELYYYGHERQRDRARKLHYLLVDASASMRGVRQVFARGLALALAKKWCLLGGEVWLRFFDSRLHERIRLGGDALTGGRGPEAARALPYVLGFRSERGRNYGRVFEQLASELGRLRREDGREVAVTFITHAECHVPASTITALAHVATLHGVFVMPSRRVTLDYLDQLAGYDIVTADSLFATPEKRRRALEIVDELTRGRGAGRAPGAGGR